MKASDANPGGGRPLAELEQTLGLAFRDQGLLCQAFTHRSYVSEKGGTAADTYERLEFLGDVVARLIVSEELYHRLPDCDEGGLTRRWTALLSQRALAVAADRLELGDYARLGRGCEEEGGRRGEAIRGDVMESLIAAVYLDAGYDAARRLVLDTLAEPLGRALEPGWQPDNPKSDLQEFLQREGKPTPTYRVVERSGQDHSPQFVVEVVMDGKALGVGVGRSKSAAETEAARKALTAIS